MSLQCVSLWFRMRKKFWRLLKFLVRTRCIGRLGWVFSCVGDGSLVWILFCWWTLLYQVNGVHHHFAILFAALMCSVLRVRKHWAKDELSSLASIYRETSFYKCMYNCLKPKTLHQFSIELSFYLFRKKKKRDSYHKILGGSHWHILLLGFEKHMSELFVRYMNTL